MADVLEFTGGKRCIECDEQIAPKRLAMVPDARLCTDCQQERDMKMAKAVNQLNQCARGREVAVKNRASITIKW